MSYNRYSQQIATILNGSPDIRHPMYDTRLSDAITIALDKLTIRFESLDSVTTLEHVREILCEGYPAHTWIQGTVSIELLDAVLSVAPTHFTADLGGGRSATVRFANKSDFPEQPVSDGKRFILDKFVDVSSGRLVAVPPANVTRRDGMHLSAPAFKCVSDVAGLAPSSIIATLTGGSPGPAAASDNSDDRTDSAPAPT